MARLNWAVACASVTVDRFTNTISLFHVVEELQVPPNVPEPEKGKPVPAQGFVHVSNWTRENSHVPESARGRLAFVLPGSRKAAGHTEFDIDLTSVPRTRQLTHLPVFPYAGPGDYHIELQLWSKSRWVRVHRTWISVRRQSEGPSVPGVGA